MVIKTERFEMRVDEDLLQRVDSWREEQDDLPSRAEAMRRLVELGLERRGAETVTFSDGEKALLLMVRDIQKHLEVESEVDGDFLAETIYGGHYWAPKWEMPGLFHGEEDAPDDVHFVVDVMAMWSDLERSYAKLSKQDREKVAKDADPFGANVQFDGFDGNNESGMVGIARFLVTKMDRFEEFSDRDLNSHMLRVDTYRRMLKVWKPLRATTAGTGLNAPQLVRVLKAMKYRD